MRQAFCQTLLTHYPASPFLFLTGDLGFMALEPLRDRMQDHFINMGLAEQHMIGAAAGLAATGHKVWVYSIAPFMYARPFEQIRNDICLHGLPVKLVGNGGGYGYGVMGATHHALEDYGALLTLQHMHVYVPAFREDIPPIVNIMQQAAVPSYLRLSRCTPPSSALPPYAGWRLLLEGRKGVCIAVGPIAGVLWHAFSMLAIGKRPALWVVSHLPIRWRDLPLALKQQLEGSPPIVCVEEHVRQGGAGQMLAALLLENQLPPKRFSILCAQGYKDNAYGSQEFHRRQNDLTPEHVLQALHDE